MCYTEMLNLAQQNSRAADTDCSARETLCLAVRQPSLQKPGFFILNCLATAALYSGGYSVSGGNRKLIGNIRRFFTTPQGYELHANYLQ